MINLNRHIAGTTFFLTEVKIYIRAGKYMGKFGKKGVKWNQNRFSVNRLDFLLPQNQPSSFLKSVKFSFGGTLILFLYNSLWPSRHAQSENILQSFSFRIR